MPKIYLANDKGGKDDTGLGTTHAGGGRITEFAEPTKIPTNSATAITETSLDFSNGVTYNPDTGQWIGYVAKDAIYIYDSLEDVTNNNFSKKITDTTGGSIYNNGIAYNADTGTYFAAFSTNNVLTVREFANLQDMAARTGILNTVTGTGNFNNGIEYDYSTNKWYGATNAGAGSVREFASLQDMLNGKAAASYNYFTSSADFEMGIAIVPCFTRGTLINTENGLVAVEKLSKGDLIKTLDNGYQPIRWIGSHNITAKTLVNTPELRPIRITAGALTSNVPAIDLLVSPQHRILIRSKIAQRMFGANEVLVAAKQLLAMDGVEIVEDLPAVEYFHILFDRHQIIFSNGAETESLYTGKQALRSVGDAAREEIFKLFPELKMQDPSYAPDAVRMLVPGRAGRKLVTRHIANSKDLLLA